MFRTIFYFFFFIADRSPGVLADDDRIMPGSSEDGRKIPIIASRISWSHRKSRNQNVSFM